MDKNSFFYYKFLSELLFEALEIKLFFVNLVCVFFLLDMFKK